MFEPCVCGHSHEDHGHDPEFPGSTACHHQDLFDLVDDCDCIAFDADESPETVSDKQ